MSSYLVMNPDTGDSIQRDFTPKQIAEVIRDGYTTVIRMRYSDYCTCFCEGDQVWLWDEMTDEVMARIPVADQKAAKKIMEDWKRNAPKDVICDILS